jgi:hypothetical protein
VVESEHEILRCKQPDSERDRAARRAKRMPRRGEAGRDDSTCGKVPMVPPYTATPAKRDGSRRGGEECDKEIFNCLIGFGSNALSHFR